MNNDIAELQNNSITTKLIDLIKEKIWLIFGGVLSSSVIAYLLSRFFIKSYLSEISYSSLTYSALLDNSTISALTFGIFTILIGFLFAFCIAPTVLRLLYLEKLNIYQNFHDKYEKVIQVFISICLAFPLVILVLIYFKLSIQNWLFLSFLSFLLFLFFIWNTRKNTTIDEKVKLLINGFLFGGVSLLAFYPFLIFINAINYSNIPSSIAYFIIAFIWLVYSIFNGFRVTKKEKAHYFVDFSIGILILVEIFILSSNTLKVPIAEFIGIKDNGLKIYQMSQSSYDELSPRIQTFWQFETSCNIGDENCSMLVANYDVSCTKDCDNPVYLNSQVIFRDNKNAIICPPNYEFGKNMNDRCLLIDQDILIPTSQTVKGLIDNKKIATINYLMK